MFDWISIGRCGSSYQGYWSRYSLSVLDLKNMTLFVGVKWSKLLVFLLEGYQRKYTNRGVGVLGLRSVSIHILESETIEVL